MSFTEKFLQVLGQAQDRDHCHKKLLKTIENSFKQDDLELFTKLFTACLYKFYCSECADQNTHVARGLEFLAKLAIKITLLNVPPTEVPNPDGTSSSVFDISEDPFFNNLLKSSLKYASANKMETRFNTCFFITLLLQNIGNNVEMDNILCNSILEALIERLNDARSKLRLQAIKALTRLQEPTNPDCVVMNSFLKLFTDTNAEVRKAIVVVIAPHPQSYSRIRERLSDTDLKVRHAAYKRWADINPRICLKIVDRNFILSSAFDDSDKKVKQILKDKLLPKWLNFYEGNHLNFLKALKLDGDENDFNKFEKLCPKVIELFLSINPLSDVVNGLPIDKNDKLIPTKQLNLESVMYWSNLIEFLRKRENTEDYLDQILPELTPFSDYIEKVIKEKSNSNMDEWENLNYQNIVLYLFHIASGFDFSDEVGRKKFYSLIIQILTQYRFQQKVTERIVSVAALLNTNVDSFTTDMCQVISEIREPLAEEVPSEEETRKRNFEMGVVSVRLHELEIKEEEALKNKDFELAKITCNEIKECQRRLESFKIVDKVRVSKDDPETLCRCLDILINVLKLKNMSFTPALRACMNEFLLQLSSNNVSDVHWRFVLCLGLFSLLDKETALEHANFISLPIASYSTIVNYDKAAVKVSVTCITDILRIYGLSVLRVDEDSASVSSQEQKNSRRKLYTENMSQSRSVRQNALTIETIIDIILDMLDDEDESVRYSAASSISKLMVHSFPADPELITRLILKWFNPLTEKKDTKLQQQIGIIIKCFTNNVKSAKKIIGKAILLIISSITNAPAGSPLLEIDMDNVLRFLCALTSIENDEDTENIHNNLATTVIEKISNKPTDVSVLHLTKLLTHLDVSLDDLAAQKNMVSSTEFLLADVDVESRKNLLKFISKLQKNQTFKDQSSTINGAENTLESSNNTTNISEVSRLQDPEKPEGQKRRLEPNLDKENAKKEKTSDGSKRGNSSNETGPQNAPVDKSSVIKPNGLKKNPVVAIDKISSSIILEKVQKLSGDSLIANESQENNDSENNIFEKCDYTHLKRTPDGQKNSKTKENSTEDFNGKKDIHLIPRVVLVKTPINQRKSSRTRQEEGSDENSIQQDSPNRLEQFSKTPVVFLTPLKKPPISKVKNGSTITPRASSRKRSAFTPLSARNQRMLKKSLRENPAGETRSMRRIEILQNEVIQTKKNGQLNNTPYKKRQPETPCTAIKEKPNKKPKKEDAGEITNTPLNQSRTRSGKVQETDVDKGHEKRISTRKITYSPVKAARVLRSRNLRKSLHLQRKNLASEKSEDESKKGEKSTYLKNIKKPDESLRVKTDLKKGTNTRTKRKETKNVGTDSSSKGSSAKENKDIKTGNDDKKKDENKNIQENISNNTRRSSRNQIENKTRSNRAKTITNPTPEHPKMQNNIKKIETKNKTRSVFKDNGNLTSASSGHSTRSKIKNKYDSTVNGKKITDNSQKSFKEIETISGSNKISPQKLRRSSNGVLKSLNDSLNKTNETPTIGTRRQTQNILNGLMTTRSGNRLSGNPSKITNTATSSIKKSKHADTSRNNSTSRKQLEFSSFSDETILKTFLQGDEKFENLEEFLIEDVSSLSSSSNGSKKENLLNISSTSCSSSGQEIRKSGRRRTKPKDSFYSDSDSSPHRKVLKTDTNTKLNGAPKTYVSRAHQKKVF